MRGLDKEQLADEFTDWLWEEKGLEVDKVETSKLKELEEEFIDGLPEPDAIDEYKRTREQGY